MLCEILPLDEERRADGALWLAFAARSLVDPRVAEEHEVVFDGARKLCSQVIHHVAEGGWLVAGLDPEMEAACLHALVDGLAVHGLMGRVDNETMLSILDSYLNRIILDP